MAHNLCAVASSLFCFLRGLRSVDSASELIPRVSESSFLIKSS